MKRFVKTLSMLTVVTVSAPAMTAGIPQGPAQNGPITFGCTPADRAATLKMLAKPYDEQEARDQAEIRGAACYASGPVMGQPWIAILRNDPTCPAGKRRLAVFEKARVGIWGRHLDKPVCAASVSLSDKRGQPGGPKLMIDGVAY